MFYHVEGRFGKLPPMDAPKDDGSNQNDPDDTELTDHESNQNEPTPGELANISSPVTIAAGAGPKYALITPSPFEERVHRIFVGPDGLRAIWRFALYLLVYRALHFVLQLLIFYALPDMEPTAAAGIRIFRTRDCRFDRGRNHVADRKSAVQRLRPASTPSRRQAILGRRVVGNGFADRIVVGSARSPQL